MKTLPNGVTVFNATPHPIRFWSEDWDEPVEVETDRVISAEIVEKVSVLNREDGKFTLVETEFVPNQEDWEFVEDMLRLTDVVVGSIIAAQAYPGRVMAMIPCAGYERVPPAEKRMRPDRFTVFAK